MTSSIDRAPDDTITTPQQIADTILDEVTAYANLYPNLNLDGTTSGSVVALSTSTGVTITVTISVTVAPVARVDLKRESSRVRAAIYLDFSQEKLVDSTVRYVARILHQLNRQVDA